MAKPAFASVLLDLALGKPLDYAIPADLQDKIQRGVRVEAPVRGKSCQGYVVDLKEKPEFFPVHPISKLLTEEALITPELFELAQWMARYYCAPLRDVLQTVVPATVRKGMKPKQQLYVQRAQSREKLREHCIAIRNKFPQQADVLDVMITVTKGILLTELLEWTEGTRSPVDTLAKQGWLHLDTVKIDRSPLVDEEYFQTKPKNLNPEQAAAFAKITGSLEESKFETHLIVGVTGSGKTEIYLQAIQRAMGLGKGSLMLVPEISLTAQTIERFRSRFEGHIAILHHRLSDGERFDEWNKIRKGEVDIVIGARSAIFSPLPNLGLIIVDEEQESSYKQTDDAPCYHARDIAVMRAKMKNATVILGSATPSLESFYNAEKGKYTLSRLSVRADAASIPKVSIVDMREEYAKVKGMTSFSEKLLDGIKKRCEAGEQTILFLNRRGYNTHMMCLSCQKPVKCEHCDVSLTYHMKDNFLSCHLCGFTMSPPPSACPYCKSPNPMKFRGVGTEHVERALNAIFPDIRTIRVDGDTTRHKGSHQRLMREFATGKADVMIGTQMIAKGLHFPQVTLVGVLNSDAGLQIPDFRASETVFQLITQVAGRSGRGVFPGEVIIQTGMPDNTTILFAAKQDYDDFYKEEIKVRELFEYPPFRQMVKFTFSGLEEKVVHACACDVRDQWIKLLPSTFTVNAVVPCGHAKVKDKYRFQFLICGPNIYSISDQKDKIHDVRLASRKVKLLIDVNPLSTFL